MLSTAEIPDPIDILFFSRGRGKGHAIPDLAILRALRAISPNTTVAFASYSTGADVFAAAREHCLDLGLSETSPFTDVLVCAAHVLRASSARLVVSHEEPAALTAAAIFQMRSVFVTHWFASPQDPYIHALKYAERVLFMEREGLFPEPSQVRGRVSYLGPVFRFFQYSPADRDRARAEVGLSEEDTLILTLPGSPPEEREPVSDLVLNAFTILNRPGKRMIWVAGRDFEYVTRIAGDRPDIKVVETDWQLDRLMAAGDLAITKGTYNIGRELNIFGIPSISISHGANFVDDLYSRSMETNTFLWAKETDPSALVKRMEEALQRGRMITDPAAFGGCGAARAAACLAEMIAESPSN